MNKQILKSLKKPSGKSSQSKSVNVSTEKASYKFFSNISHIGDDRYHTLAEAKIKTPQCLNKSTQINHQLFSFDLHPNKVSLFREKNGKVLLISSQENIECSIQKCPQHILPELETRFSIPDTVDIQKLNILLFNKQTEVEMVGYSPEVEEERCLLAESFKHDAQIICEYLKQKNFYCDFIDPTTAMPYYNKNKDASILIETNPLMEYIGQMTVDSGCCKVLFHPRFGSNVMAFMIITDASPDSPFLTNVIASFL